MTQKDLLIKDFREKFGPGYLYTVKNNFDTSHISYELTDENMPLLFREMEGWLSQAFDSLSAEVRSEKEKEVHQEFKKMIRESTKEELLAWRLELKGETSKEENILKEMGCICHCHHGQDCP